MRNISRLQASPVVIDSVSYSGKLLEADCGPCCGQTDTLIVDNKHDLNVYATAQEDGTKNSCCGKSSLASPSSKNEALRNGSEGSSIDFNEWAGNVPDVQQASPMFVIWNRH